MAKKGNGLNRGLTQERRETALAAHRQTGCYARTAAAMGIPDRTFRHWLVKDPTFKDELDAQERELDRDIGVLARKRLQEHLESVGAMRVTSRKRTRDKRGEDFTEEVEERVEANVAMVRTALTKMDPTWTHPKQEVEHSGSVTLAQALAQLEGE